MVMKLTDVLLRVYQQLESDLGEVQQRLLFLARKQEALRSVTDALRELIEMESVLVGDNWKAVRR